MQALRRWFWLLPLPLLLGCRAHIASTPAAGRALFFLQRKGESWVLMRQRWPDGECHPVAEAVDGYAVGDQLILIRGERLEREDGRVMAHCRSACFAAALSPDARWLAWLEGDAPATELCLLALGEEEVMRIGKVRSRPVWSPDGAHVVAAMDNGLLLWSAATATTETLPLQAISAPSWVDAQTLALVLAPGRPVLYTLGDPFPRPMALQEFGDVVEIGWSPTGAMALLLRTEHRAPPTTEGRAHDEHPGATTFGPQPYLYRVGEPGLRPLPGDAGALFTHPVWLPDGRYVALVRIGSPPAAPPQVWVYAVETGEVVQRFERAALPAWH